jgi:hypothetical protein
MCGVRTATWQSTTILTARMTQNRAVRPQPPRAITTSEHRPHLSKLPGVRSSRRLICTSWLLACQARAMSSTQQAADGVAETPHRSGYAEPHQKRDERELRPIKIHIVRISPAVSVEA